MYIRGSRVLNLDAMSDQELLALLRGIHTRKDQLFCCCKGNAAATSIPLALHVRQRGTTFSLVKAANSGLKHARGCRHASLAEQDVAKLGYTAGALSVDDDDRTVVRLSFSLTNAQSVVDELPVSFSFSGNTRPRPVVSQASLLGLLHLLWERAGLHRHCPGQLPSLVEALTRIRGAARSVRRSNSAITQWGLEEYLLLPAVGTREEQEAQMRANNKKLRDAYERRRKVLFLAICQGPNGAKSLLDEKGRLSFKSVLQANVRTKMATTLAAELGSRFPAATAAYARGERTVLFGVATTAGYKGSVWAEPDQLVAMPVTSAWIPFDSAFEQALADVLVLKGRAFEKPMRYDSKEPVFPDFVLEDCKAGKHILEVYGVAGRPAYEARRDEKREIYRSDYPGSYWEWDAVFEPDITRWLTTAPLPT